MQKYKTIQKYIIQKTKKNKIQSTKIHHYKIQNIQNTKIHKTKQKCKNKNTKEIWKKGSKNT